jgi:hypothetical protein
MTTYPTLDQIEATAEAIIDAAEASYNASGNEAALDAGYDIARRLVASFERFNA